MVDFRQARDFLLAHRTDHAGAVASFRWPEPEPFNWALDWFDAELAANPESRDRLALTVVDTAAGTQRSLTFAELSARSNRVANWLAHLGARRGDHLLLVLGNVVPLWETMLAAMKIGLVVIPATTLLSREELADRLERGKARIVVAAADHAERLSGLCGPETLRIAVGGAAEGWRDFAEADVFPATFRATEETFPDEPMLLYFTSGTTAKPKLVLHTHRTYPVGSLSTMYWIGLQPGDLHLNISSPGWAKHAWSSFFAPWNAGATVLALNQPRFDAKVLLTEIAARHVTTFCAPPTVWRFLIQEDLASVAVSLREAVSAGEPLNPEIVEQVRAAWGITVREGYGQSETTAMVGNSPGQTVTPGAMGPALPGWRIGVIGADGKPEDEGEICVFWDEDERPAGLTPGYLQPNGSIIGARISPYRTGDLVFGGDAIHGAKPILTFVGRRDDVFKSSDYRISPFELESVLLEHPAVAEAAVVPSPDPFRLSVPKAYVSLAEGFSPDIETARSILRHSAERLSPFRRVRIIAFVAELPKTVSGKIRRAHLRHVESGERDDDLVLACFAESVLDAEMAE